MLSAATSRRVPAGLLVSGAGWVALAAALLTVGLNGPRGSFSEGSVGGGLIATPTGAPPAVLVVVAAFVVVLLNVCLLAGLGWAAYPLVGLGVLTVLLLALNGTWLTLPAMVGLVAGSAPLCLPGPYAYLTGR